MDTLALVLLRTALANSRAAFEAQWLDPVLEAGDTVPVSTLAPRQGHRSGSNEIMVQPAPLPPPHGFPPGDRSRWCVGIIAHHSPSSAARGERQCAGGRCMKVELDDGSDWSVPCHKPGPLAAGDGIWLRNMSPGVYELWLILVQAGAGAPRAGERVAGVYPRARRGLRVTVLNGTAVNRDYHLWYVDNVGMPGLDHPRFMGVPVQKSLNDLWTTQELLHELRPRAVVEFGTLHGGSALYYAHTLRSVLTADAGAGAGSAGEHGYPFHVLTVDIARENVHARTLAHPAIEVLTASSLSEECARRTAETLHGARAGGGDARVLVLLDSLHTKAHVMAEMELVAPLMRAGDYLIVEDTHHNHHPVPYSDEVGGPGPYEAVEEFERAHPGWFTHDAKRESKFGFTWNPKGYLIRTRVGWGGVG